MKWSGIIFINIQRQNLILSKEIIPITFKLLNTHSQKKLHWKYKMYTQYLKLCLNLSHESKLRLTKTMMHWHSDSPLFYFI